MVRTLGELFGPGDTEMRTLKPSSAIVTIFFPVFLTSCAIPTFPTFTNYDRLELSDQQVATIENRWGCPWCIKQVSGADGILLYEVNRDRAKDRFKLTPGTYLVRIAYQATKIPRVSREGTAELRAGHVYAVKYITCLGSMVGLGACQGREARTSTVWIEDTATGEVIVGEKWD